MPDISILMITYNHGAFIAKAIEGVLLQQTHYSMELIIGEDKSTDDTRKICETYALKYPGKIKLLPSDHNYGMGKNFIRTMEACTGKYIAICEGDDYWIDKNKLQTQVMFLEKNMEYSLCFHDVFFSAGNNKYNSGKWDAPDTSDINYLLSHASYITTLSVVFRAHASVLEFLNKAVNAPFLDFFVYVAAAQYGLLKFFPDKMGVYRVHDGGIWSQLGLVKATEKTIMGYRILYALLPDSQKEQLKIKYLIALEDFFYNVEVSNFTILSIENLIITEAGIQPFIIEYIHQRAIEQKKMAFFIKKIPIKKLMHAILYKIKNKYWVN